MATVGLVHRHDVWAEGVASLVTNCGLDFVGQWPNVTCAAELLADSPPDLLIVAGQLVDRRSKEILLKMPRRPAIIMLIEPQERISYQKLNDIPIEGLLMTDASLVTVEECIRTVGAGHAWIDTSILRSPAGTANQTNWTCLSDRELEVAHLAATGLSNKRIAQRLRVSDGTIKMHMHHILAKLHLERRAGLSSGDVRLSKLSRRAPDKAR